MDRYILKEKIKPHRNGMDKIHYVDIRERDTNVEVGSVYCGYEGAGKNCEYLSKEKVMADIKNKISEYESLVK